MIHATDFVQAGYRSYDSGFSLMFNRADYFFQKCICNAEGEKLFYINVYVYEHYNKDYYPRNTHLQKISFAPEMQITRKEKPTLDIAVVSMDYETVKEMEEDMLNIWKNLEGIKYDE